MDFELSDEQQMLRGGVQRFVREQYTLEQRRRLVESADGFSRAHWAQFAELGWLMLNVPEDAGGLGFGFTETAVVMQELGYAMVLEPFVPTAVLGVRIIDRAASPTQRETLLTQLAAGELLLALAHGEPTENNDLAAVTTTARRDTNTGGFTLDGRKCLVLGAQAANRLIVSAKVDGETDYSLLLVDPSTPGIRVDAYALIDGSRAADLVLDQVGVDGDALLAGPGRAREVLEEALDRALLALLAEAVGVMEACLDVTSAYVKERVQFGQPIGRFQTLQHILAEMFVRTQEARSMLYHGMAHIDDEAPARGAAVSAAKMLIARNGQLVSGSAIQLHGGYGITADFAVSHYYKRLLVIEKLFGDADFHAERFAQGSNP